MVTAGSNVVVTQKTPFTPPMLSVEQVWVLYSAEERTCTVTLSLLLMLPGFDVNAPALMR